jgi:hypothetical protein
MQEEKGEKSGGGWRAGGGGGEGKDMETEEVIFPRQTDSVKRMDSNLEKTGNRPVEKTVACPSPLPLCFSTVIMI